MVYICGSDSDAVQVMDPKTSEVLHDLPVEAPALVARGAM